MKSDARRGLHYAAHRPVVTLPKRRKPEGRSRSGDRGELPHAATEEFAKSYRINLRLLPELAFSFEHDASFFGARHRDFRGRATRDCSPVRFVVRDKAARAADVPRGRGRAKRLSQFNSKFNKLV